MTYHVVYATGWPGRWYLLPLVSFDRDGEPWSEWSISIGWLRWGMTLLAQRGGDERPE